MDFVFQEAIKVCCYFLHKFLITHVFSPLVCVLTPSCSKSCESKCWKLVLLLLLSNISIVKICRKSVVYIASVIFTEWLYYVSGFRIGWNCICIGLHSDPVVHCVALQQEIPWFKSRPGPFFAEFACSTCAGVDIFFSSVWLSVC